MSVWRFVVPQAGMGERAVPAPKTALLMGEPSGNVIIRAQGTWIHEEDWPYLSELKFPCRGLMRNGFVIGCPDANQFATMPPEPPIEPPAPFFEMPIEFNYEAEAIEPPEESTKFYRNKKRRERS